MSPNWRNLNCHSSYKFHLNIVKASELLPQWFSQKYFARYFKFSGFKFLHSLCYSLFYYSIVILYGLPMLRLQWVYAWSWYCYIFLYYCYLGYCSQGILYRLCQIPTVALLQTSGYGTLPCILSFPVSNLRINLRICYSLSYYSVVILYGLHMLRWQSMLGVGIVSLFGITAICVIAHTYCHHRVGVCTTSCGGQNGFTYAAVTIYAWSC